LPVHINPFGVTQIVGKQLYTGRITQSLLKILIFVGGQQVGTKLAEVVFKHRNAVHDLHFIAVYRCCWKTLGIYFPHQAGNGIIQHQNPLVGAGRIADK